MWGFFKDNEAFKRHFPRSGGFFKLIWGLEIGFLKTFPLKFGDFVKISNILKTF
jgi:hypothetical protein